MVIVQLQVTHLGGSFPLSRYECVKCEWPIRRWVRTISSLRRFFEIPGCLPTLSSILRSLFSISPSHLDCHVSITNLLMLDRKSRDGTLKEREGSISVAISFFFTTSIL